VRGRPATPPYKALIAHHVGWAEEAGVAFGWPSAHEKAKRRGDLRPPVEMAGLPVEDGSSSTGASTPWAVPTVPPPDPRPRAARGRAAPAWRCDDPKVAARWPGRWCLLTLSAPPAGLTGMGRSLGGGSPSELLGIWPALVDKALVDPQVRVAVEEVT